MSSLLVSIENLKADVVAFVKVEGFDREGASHNLLAKFAAFVEGKQAEQDAIDLLVKAGYTLNQPIIVLPAPTTL